jgi:hypothetical protein
VIISISEAGKSLLTVSAFEGFLSGVKAHVHLEIGLFNRRLRAVGAFENLNLTAGEMSLLEMSL